MRVLSGIQPSGLLHLGNYFAMMRPVIEMTRTADVYIFIANYHAMTTVDDAKSLRGMTLDVALDFLACGLDPDRVTFYRQSDVPEVTELTWILSNVTPMGLLERCVSYKDKISRGISSNHGLFAYPVLMAADILAVQSDVVPVGGDQKQHLEVTRDIAEKFNQSFGETFKIPEPRIEKSVAVIPGLDGQKMSKSYGNTIEIFGDPKPTRKKIMRIVTDSKTVDEPKDPEASTIYQLYRLLAEPAEAAELAARYRAGGMGYGDAKKALAEAFESYFAPMRARREELAGDLAYVEDVLAAGAAKAKQTARQTLDAARSAVGLA
jgi:tryptophanyl-tRNA synthetase